MATEDVNGVTHDLSALFSSGERDFLVRNNGDQVNISSLNGKIIGLYFSGSWCGPCRRFTPKLVELYNEIASKGDFEVVFVSSDRDDDSFNDYFSEMPWLAIPFSDPDTIKPLKELFNVRGIPKLVIIDSNGKVSTENGTSVVTEYGVDGYPFSRERIDFLKEQEEEAKRNQTLSSILVSSSRDYLLSKDGNQVPVSELEGKTVGLYFSVSSHEPCVEFTTTLVEVYNKLKEKSEKFEIVLISLNYEEEEFKKGLETIPWLALPFKDKIIEKLVRYFELSTIPTLVIIGPDGKTVSSNVAEIVEDHGIDAYPFTPEKLASLAEIEKAKQESQTLESLLVSGDNDFVIGKNGSKVPVSELVGKNIVLYFSAHWCPPCRGFTPKLIKAYQEIKEKDDAFEVIFISSDSDQSSFDEYFSIMPWLALPYGDSRKKLLNRRFKVEGIPTAIAIGPSGRTVTKEVVEFVIEHGAKAYPFTEEQLKHLEEQEEEVAKGWPEKLKHDLHAEHELKRTRRKGYCCDACDEMGKGWSFYCEECDFDLHPKCALEKVKEEGQNGVDVQNGKAGIVCEGDVCRRV
ncbi:probable nucleoredoxin 1 [Humulus lupulus]|uniref:probable nucleoredoxin 1 n=1 Tax=Humulus lupulus TaxID=3486 RepID=UPI002B40C51B|nr:probable nucleoredoxin 1 [Humulus lupulus]